MLLLCNDVDESDAERVGPDNLEEAVKEDGQGRDSCYYHIKFNLLCVELIQVFCMQLNRHKIKAHGKRPQGKDGVMDKLEQKVLRPSNYCTLIQI